MKSSIKLLRISDVANKTTLAKSTLWLKIAKGEFPKPIKISPAISVWKEADVDSWIESFCNPNSHKEAA
ncbi:AlpA family transcriptional regulator [Polynucleobacter sp. JS-Fieb-80-E5]|jgi:prophage regulatory protein|uniref:helix-turn-helix transcriptional regulator n=1 Tax=Polynucleobacter sp. JS-Fieb-80-E5 TaxID=2081050 RepID=UPI001C0AAC5E|nr:AlpA family phage regulatory protein [Polynucleobacter sp. JS-Fieb-80-E5]MBU3617606.1 AlpA family phage regulatory protein [Polynucleobacter sp. JS-Fieb-80-E5]